MKKHIALYAVIAAALLAAPVASRAQETPATPPAGETGAKPRKGALPFHGKVSAVDTTAMTVTVGSLVINVTPKTKITNAGKPATLEDLKVGEMIGGAYKKDDAGKLTATAIHIGAAKKQKKAE